MQPIAYQVSLFSIENRNLFTMFKAIVRLRSVSPTILLRRATPVIVGLFAGRTLQTITSGVPSFPHNCVIFCTMYSVDKYGRELRNINWGAGRWRPIV